MANDDSNPSMSRRALITRIAASASDGDAHRAERLLLRGLARRWPEQRICRLLAILQRSLPQSIPGPGR